jgi:hypothetical protein
MIEGAFAIVATYQLRANSAQAWKPRDCDLETKERKLVVEVLVPSLQTFCRRTNSAQHLNLPYRIVRCQRSDRGVSLHLSRLKMRV